MVHIFVLSLIHLIILRTYSIGKKKSAQNMALRFRVVFHAVPIAFGTPGTALGTTWNQVPEHAHERDGMMYLGVIR
jgi:hypothetical protein